MNLETARELLPDYALGLLEPDEAAAVEHLLASEPGLRAELQQYLHAAEALAFAYEPAELPPGAAERIAAGVRQRIAAASAPLAEPIPFRPRPAITPWRAIALASAAASLVLAVGLAAALIAWLDARSETDRLRDELAARPLQLPIAGDGAAGAIFVAPDFSYGLLVLRGLPPAPQGHHYQLWSEGPYGARSAADFEGAQGPLVVQLPELPREMTRMFVTLEPDGAGGDRPQGPEVLSTPR